MSRYRKFTTICCAAVFALGLAACGGGSDGGPTAEQQAQIDQAADLRAEIAALRALLGLDPADNLEDSVEKLRDDLADLRQQQADDATEKADEARVATAKALKAAIGRPATTDGTVAITVTPTSIPAIDLDGAGAETETSAALTLKKGASVGALGSWKGTDYAGMAGTGDDKTTGMVRVYTNEAASKGVSFTSEAGNSIHSLTGDPVGDYGLDETAAYSAVKSASFPTTGQRTYTGDARKFSGSFMDAPGTFTCTGTSCTATIDAAGAITLAGDAATWTFTPDAGAMLQQRDASYLRFGWWVRKDKDGPTHAGVFYGGAGGTVPDPLADTAINNANLIGKATYAGAAAGKFAISDPLRPGYDNSGHFTADAELTADFKGAGAESTLTGTIDEFRLNDGSDDPGWSVALREDALASGDTSFSGTTLWTIGGAKGTAGGSWEAQMFNDKPNDGTNVPLSTVGSFRSDFGSTHSLVGAFGATKQ